MKTRFLLGLLLALVIPLSNSEELPFKHDSTILSGHYLQPTGDKPPKAVILFVHGDGAMSYDAEGYYDFIWEPLRENGYAIFSWDKPGVGDSSGNWLQQSMADRQSEVRAAIQAVQKRHGFTAENTGLLGFSQAGWVVPALAELSSEVGFIIGIGFATNWIDQGRYYTRTKHALSGENAEQIEKAIASFDEEIRFLKTSPSYSEYLEFSGSEAMSPDRFEFVMKNFQVDATGDYQKIKVPSLLLWGEDDLNVDANNEFAWWQKRTDPLVTTRLISGATHGMLDSNVFDTQVFGFKQWLKLMWYGQDALASEFTPTLIAWLDALKREHSALQEHHF